jgi:hypothetical protein
MKRFMIQVFSFGILAMMVYVLLLFVWVNYTPNPLLKNFVIAPKGLIAQKMQEIKNFESVDAVVLGSSCAYRGYDPRIFQTPLQTDFVVDNYVQKLHPKFVIFDIRPQQFAEDGLESTLDFLANGIEISTMDFSSKNMKVYNTYIYAKIFKRFIDKKNTIRDFNGTYISGGYVENFKVLKSNQDTPKSRICKILPEQLKAFEQAVNKIKASHIPFYLVQSPIPKKTYESLTNNEAMDDMFSKMGPYYNFNKIIHLPDSLFYDDIHLNQHGVNAFNKKLIETIGDRLRE